MDSRAVICNVSICPANTAPQTPRQNIILRRTGTNVGEKTRRFGNSFVPKGAAGCSCGRYSAPRGKYGQQLFSERERERSVTRAAGALCGDFGRIALIDIAQPIKAHVHPHAHLLFKVAGVDSSFQVGDRLVPMTADTVVLVNSWQAHSYPRDGLNQSSLVLGLYIDRKWLDFVDPWFQLTTRDRLFTAPCISLSKRVRDLLHDAAAAARGDSIATRSHEYLVASLICEVTRVISPMRLAQSGPHLARRSGIQDFRIRKAIELMTSQVGVPRDMEEIASLCALSRAHFFELFKTNVGITPLMFSHALRMEAAYEALVDVQANLTQIGANLGFSTPAHFTRFFRDHLGATPSEFRHAAVRNPAISWLRQFTY